MAAPMETLDKRPPEDPDHESFWPDFLRVVDRVMFSQGLQAAMENPAADAAVETAAEVLSPPLDTVLGIGQVLMGEIMGGPLDALVSAEEDSLAGKAAKAASGMLALALAA